MLSQEGVAELAGLTRGDLIQALARGGENVFALDDDSLAREFGLEQSGTDDANLLHTEEAIRVALPKGKTHHLLRAGDLLFRSRGRSNGAAQVLEGIDPAVLAAPMLLIRSHGVLPAYLCWYLNAPATQAQLAALAEGTSVRMISVEALKALEVPLPSLAAQQGIVQAAALAEQEQALLARIARLRQRLTTQLLMKLAHPSPERATP